MSVSTGARPRPNPLAKQVQEQMRPFLTRLDDVSGRLFLDCQMAQGLSPDGDGEQFRTTTDAECLSLHVGFAMECDIDASKPIVPQLVAWLVRCAADIDVARINASRIKEPLKVKVTV